jgi:hypothetical protein
VPDSLAGVPALLALYLVLISVLALPRVRIMLWIDYKENLFSRTAGLPDRRVPES